MGSAKGGTRTYVLERASGVALGILTPYMIGVGIYLFGRERQSVVDSISTFWVGPPLAAFIILNALHMDIGMRTITEDYVHSGHLHRLHLCHVADDVRARSLALSGGNDSYANRPWFAGPPISVRFKTHLPRLELQADGLVSPANIVVRPKCPEMMTRNPSRRRRSRRLGKRRSH
ncbi:succinate dehydrogenase, hydrophobic membrane anchor protein [Rhizobium populisoli]|uniref:succinate dehydrogenase, hydrophobic membrane anchor protein n=1 Tax=Rhizobium populisoli TaxID=2859785 RepID=UPI0028A611AD|nr:succinate dehydrogenase, hydrophobic membrane anchor protein [Rhizobium populisoli]